VKREREREREREKEREKEREVPIHPFAHRHHGLTRVSSVLLFSVFLLPLSDGKREARKREKERERERQRESDAEDDAGAAKLDTSPAVLSPSFILRTFLPVTSLDALPSFHSAPLCPLLCSRLSSPLAGGAR